jgi:hypothetical protein
MLKKKNPYSDEMNEAIHKKRWIPLGGYKVAVILVLLLTSFVIAGTLFLPQMMEGTPLRFGGAVPKLETYDSPDKDPRKIAWVGTHDFMVVLREFTIDLGMPVQHGLFQNCSSLIIPMKNEGYRAHLYVLSAYTTANQMVDMYGNVGDTTVLTNYTAADCGVLIRSVHPQAKILCLVEGRVDSYIATECHDDGLFILLAEEAIMVDTIETDITMTRAEAVIRDLVELPILPSDQHPRPDYTPPER